MIQKKKKSVLDPILKSAHKSVFRNLPTWINQGRRSHIGSAPSATISTEWRRWKSPAVSMLEHDVPTRKRLLSIFVYIFLAFFSTKNLFLFSKKKSRSWAWPIKKAPSTWHCTRSAVRHKDQGAKTWFQQGFVRRPLSFCTMVFDIYKWIILDLFFAGWGYKTPIPKKKHWHLTTGAKPSFHGSILRNRPSLPICPTRQGTAMIMDEEASLLKRSWCLFELLQTVRRGAVSSCSSCE